MSDGETALLTDGFFTRPPLWRMVAWRVAPDPGAIEAALERAGIERLAAVVVVHSRLDHAMDSPLVAERTGALLVGSESTAQIARGLGARRVVPIHYDDFTLPLEELPAALPNLLDDVAGSLRFLRARAGPGRDVRLAPAWRAVDPFGTCRDSEEC